MDRWTGKVALVTGASSGIGAAIALALANEGMKVVGIARERDRIEALSKKVSPAKKGSIIPLKCDVTQIEEIDSVFETIKKEYGGVDVCINNAGISFGTTLLDGTPAEWKKVTDVNVIALCYCSKLSTQSMIERNVEEGHIINISSIAAHLEKIPGILELNFYSSTKHAVKFITEGLRQEMLEKKYKIRVTAISPGAVNTDIFRRSFAGNEELIKNFKSQLPIIEPESIAQAVVFILGQPPGVEINDIIHRGLWYPY